MANRDPRESAQVLQRDVEDLRRKVDTLERRMNAAVEEMNDILRDWRSVADALQSGNASSRFKN